MKYAYTDTPLKRASLILIDQVNEIVDEYEAQGYVLTVRQIYYQLVSKDLIPNTLKSYKRVASIINSGKMAGLIDWDMIEDRTRAFKSNQKFDSGRDCLNDAAKYFHMDLWESQPTRVFIIIEKEALFGVFDRIARQYDIPLLAARGYPSGSVLHEFVHDRIIPFADQSITILHFGDHDPSGIDMTRDLTSRIDTFCQGEADFDLIRCALNMDQVEELNPPRNPAKTTDSRFDKYAEMFGDSSWELDALPPSYLNNLVTEHVDGLIDAEAWDARREEIDEIKIRLREVAKTF